MELLEKLLRPLIGRNRPMKSNCRLLTVVLLLAWLLVACPPPPVPVNVGDSVRMGTFNVQFLPGSSDDETRSVKIADRILASTYDIIALNEVFDEEARDKFVEKLKGTFPHYVAYLGDDAVGSQDSGLMLFSRYPFEALPRATHKADPGNLVARSGGVDWKEVGFIEYDEDVFPDNWAAKGVAFVRIRNPHTSRVYNVAFTHMQASYPEDEDDLDEWKEPIDARQAQFEDVRRIIVDTLNPEQLLREDIFVLGDLNVDGDLRDPNLGAGVCCQPNLYEWVARFDTAGSYFATSMFDAWAHEQSPDDPGLSNFYHWGPDFAPDTGARLDYILRNRPPSLTGNSRLAIQHLTLAHNMREGAPFIESGLGMAGVTELSDHIGLNADVNRWAPHCSVVEAVANPALDIFQNGVITYPGSMQWYRFDTPGTYAFVLPTAGMEYRVYSSKDLSTPSPQYFSETITFVGARGQTHEGDKYHLPDPPFFVRVFHSDRTATGNYDLMAHRADCTSKEEACLIRANDPMDHAMPPTPVNADDTLWFQVRTQAADSGRPQSLRFIVDNFNQDILSLELRREDGTSVVDADTTAEPVPGVPGLLQLEIARNDLPGAATTYYLLVKRSTPSALTFRIRWETNLTILHGALAGVPGSSQMNLYCVEETDTIGIDEVFLTVKVDGTTIVNDVYIGEFDDGIYRTLEDLIPVVRFLDKVDVILREEDGGFNGADDFLTTVVLPLSADKTQALAESAVLASAGGKYLFRHNRSRSLSIDP
jgi:hypothetical protein